MGLHSKVAFMLPSRTCCTAGLLESKETMITSPSTP